MDDRRRSASNDGCRPGGRPAVSSRPPRYLSIGMHRAAGRNDVVAGSYGSGTIAIAPHGHSATHSPQPLQKS